MILRVSFKTPDAIDDETIRGNLEEEMDRYEEENNIRTSTDWTDKRNEMIEQKLWDAKEFVEQFIEYGECCTLEFDTDKKTVVVLKKQ